VDAQTPVGAALRASVQVIFDTDVLIWASRLDPHAKEFILAERDRAASMVTLMEVLAGAKSKADLMITRRFFMDLEIRLIPVDESISYLAANLIEDHRLVDGLGVTNAVIAATAREAGETLATGNVPHFRGIPNLALKSFRPSRP
jgi:predicted nucleic acid-binding protein